MDANPKMADKGSKVGRIVLIVAALLAVGSIGITVARKTGRPDSPPVSGPAKGMDAPAASPQEAIARLEARLKDQPDDREGWRNLGWAFFQTGRYAEAATAYRKLTALAPGDVNGWSSLGEALFLSGDGASLSPDAKAAFQKARSLDPGDARARYFGGVEKHLGGDSKGAIEDWLALLKDTPSGAPWEADLRRTVLDVGKLEKIDVAKRLAAIRPAMADGGVPSVATAGIPGPTPDEMRAAASLPKGQQDVMVQGMVESLESKLKANPGNADGWIMLMRSRTTLGEGSKAAAAYQSAMKAFAGDAAQQQRLTAAARELGVPGS